MLAQIFLRSRRDRHPGNRFFSLNGVCIESGHTEAATIDVERYSRCAKTAGSIADLHATINLKVFSRA